MAWQKLRQWSFDAFLTVLVPYAMVLTTCVLKARAASRTATTVRESRRFPAGIAFKVGGWGQIEGEQVYLKYEVA